MNKLEECYEGIYISVKRELEDAFERGVSEGARRQRQWLREQLEKYKADSIVAQILLDMNQER